MKRWSIVLLLLLVLAGACIAVFNRPTDDLALFNPYIVQKRVSYHDANWFIQNTSGVDLEDAKPQEEITLYLHGLSKQKLTQLLTESTKDRSKWEPLDIYKDPYGFSIESDRTEPTTLGMAFRPQIFAYDVTQPSDPQHEFEVCENKEISPIELWFGKLRKIVRRE